MGTNRVAAAMAVMLTVSGCKAVQAPETLEELMVFGFVNFDERDDYLTAFGDGAIPFVDAHREEVLAGYVVDSLGGPELEEAGVEKEDEVDIIGLSAVTDIDASLDEVADAMTFGDMTQVFSNTLEFDIDEATDRGCFIDKACEEYTWAGTRTIDLGLFGTSTQAFSMWARRVETEASGPVVVIRNLSPEPCDITSPFFQVDQQYSLTLLYEEDGATRRLETIWVDARVVGLDVPEDFALDTAVKQLETAALDLETYINGEPSE